MPDDQATRYARAGDGAYLAYRVVGDGSRTVLVLQGFFLSIDSIDDEPRWAAFDRRLAAMGSVTRYDVRGVGLSDSSAGGAGVESSVDDALAVLDAVGADRAVVIGSDGASITALALAIEHPERVAELVIVNGYARLERADDYPAGVPTHLIDRFIDNVTDPGASDPIDDVGLTAPSLVDDARFRRWWVRASSRAAGPAAARDILRFNCRTDLRDGLSMITAPTLILHRRDNQLVGVDHGRYLAQHISHARYVELEGADHVPWAGDGDAIIAEIETFLGVSSGANLSRRVATLLVTDLVASTEEAARIGDRRWREQLDSHDATTREHVERNGGRVVKFTGDGVLAEFTSPSGALAAAREIIGAVELPIRVGLHSGEVEIRGDDLGGLAVHIAARVQSHAEGGEILVSRTVADLVAGSDFAFTDRGDHELKGVPGRWQLFAVDGSPTG